MDRMAIDGSFGRSRVKSGECQEPSRTLVTRLGSADPTLAKARSLVAVHEDTESGPRVCACVKQPFVARELHCANRDAQRTLRQTGKAS